ncbi:unnamed protein product [Zymoseptoria tritici ST99CH_3D7]|uniref:Uncharacterized protein n=1 Tax=Zymoseptoria tritici (strain ST99CH_3D7) TaxID=1276538 RepID=A0A1X7S998_ZYMT9|nr:unnamed protein product [Zymoseptoria tritici ST99CH_3D7]
MPRIARGIATAAGLRPYQALHDRATTTLAARVRNKKRPDVGWMWVRDHEWEVQKKERMIWRRKWLAIWAIAYAVFRDQRDGHQELIEKDFNMVGSKIFGKYWPWGGTTTGQARKDMKAKDGAATKDFPGQRGWFWKDTGLNGEFLGCLGQSTLRAAATLVRILREPSILTWRRRLLKTADEALRLGLRHGIIIIRCHRSSNSSEVEHSTAKRTHIQLEELSDKEQPLCIQFSYRCSCR